MDKQFKFYRDLIEESSKNLKKKHELSNLMMIPRVQSVHLSVSAGKFFKNAADMEKIQTALGYIAGQRAIMIAAKKSVAAFDVREGMKTGLKVTLRKSRMQDFLDRLKIIYLPRIREFKGLSGNSFNGRAFSMGIKDAAAVFPEIVSIMNTYDFTFGMNITIVFSNDNTVLQKDLLTELGFPFK